MFDPCIVHVSAHDIKMILNGHYIVSLELWQPLVRLFWHCIGVSLDSGHVKGFVEVFFLKEIHWIKGKGTLENRFDNGRIKRRPYLVELRRLEPPMGKILGRGRVLGGCIHQMRFNMISTRNMEREHPLGGVYVDTERGVNQYQIEFKNFFNLYLNHSIISNEK